MASITIWNRLEPVSRNERLTSLEARVADPLWMLARQWQTGELTGSNTGTPVSARLSVEQSPLSRWSGGAAGGGVAGRLAAVGLVEPRIDGIRDTIGISDRARGGRYFLRRLGTLAARYGARFTEAFAFEIADFDGNVGDLTDARSARIARLLVRRALDGGRFRAELGEAGAIALPAEPDIDQGDADEVLAAASDFASWWDGQYSAADGAWQSPRLGAPFRFEVETSRGALGLAAPDHRGQRLDWWSFDTAAAPASGDPASAPADAVESLPTRIGFAGMPRPRWWEFEDAAVDLTRSDAAPDDLGRLLLAEFSLLYGNDFFCVPVEVDVGAVCRVARLEVRTCFGEIFEVPSAAAFDSTHGSPRNWRMFHNDGDVGGTGLVLAPTSVGDLVGSPREEVLFARDEMANVAWAIEIKVSSPAGAVVERREVDQARQTGQAQDAPGSEPLSYRLSTTVPASWYPLEPQTDGTLRFRGIGKTAGRLLATGENFILDSSELPKVGRRLRLVSHRARTDDGAVVVWLGWSAGPGRAESASGLQFDALMHGPPATT